MLDPQFDQEFREFCGGHICGVDEFKHGRPCYDHLPRQAAQNSFCVLLSHYPLLPADGHADLALCGHTHAGQFHLLGLTPYSLPTERDTMPHGPDLIFGQKNFGDTSMIVCAGTGTSKIPLRINAAPEIVSIEFEKGFAKP